MSYLQINVNSLVFICASLIDQNPTQLTFSWSILASIQFTWGRRSRFWSRFRSASSGMWTWPIWLRTTWPGPRSRTLWSRSRPGPRTFRTRSRPRPRIPGTRSRSWARLFASFVIFGRWTMWRFVRRRWLIERFHRGNVYRHWTRIGGRRTRCGSTFAISRRSWSWAAFSWCSGLCWR